MDRTIPATDANRRFSEMLRTVKKGHSIIVTSHGKPVARVTAIAGDEQTAGQARSVLLARLRKQRPVEAGRWSRQELYNETT